jgi:hypothetical protein
VACALRSDRPKQPRINRLRGHRTDARNATAGSDDQATSLTAVEANRALRPSSTPGQLESWAGRRTSRGREPLPWHLARATVDGFWPPVDACLFCPGGLNRSAVGKTAIATSSRPQPLASPALTSLVACTGALRRAILGPGDAWGRLRPLPSLHDRPAPFPAHAPYPSIQSTYSKGRASRGFVLRRCIRKAGRAWDEATLVDGLADTRFFRRRNAREAPTPPGLPSLRLRA